MRALLTALALSAAAAACGQSEEKEAPAPTFDVEESSAPEARAAFAPVDATLLAAPNSAFTAIEPSEVGVIGADQVAHAIEPLASAEMGEGGGNVRVSIRETTQSAVADVVRADLPDDSIAAAHVRVEFIPSPEGWFPTNAYRRWQCRRAGDPNAWSTSPCP